MGRDRGLDLGRQRGRRDFAQCIVEEEEEGAKRADVSGQTGGGVQGKERLEVDRE